MYIYIQAVQKSLLFAKQELPSMQFLLHQSTPQQNDICSDNQSDHDKEVRPLPFPCLKYSHDALHQ